MKTRRQPPAMVLFIVVALPVTLAGCSLFGLGNPFVGDWNVYQDTTKTLFEVQYNADMTYTRTTDADGTTTTVRGTYSYDKSATTITESPDTGSPQTYSYSLGGTLLDKNQLTLTDGKGNTLTYTKLPKIALLAPFRARSEERFLGHHGLHRARALVLNYDLRQWFRARRKTTPA